MSDALAIGTVTDVPPGERGDFSSSLILARMALQELGDSEASYFVSSQKQRFLNYLNRVVTDVNRHPLYLDLLDTAYEDQQGTMALDSQTLLITGSPTVTFNQYTPVKVAGAGTNKNTFAPFQIGAGNSSENTPTTTGDLYSFILKQTTSGGNAVANSWQLADVARNDVTDVVVSHPYKTRLPRYTDLDDDIYRPIDDEVMVLGVKSYFMKDDADTNNAGLITLAQTEYTLSINSWLGSLVNLQGNLTIEINEYT